MVFPHLPCVTAKASWFERELSHADSPPSSSATFLSVSAKDVLLDEASSSLFGRRDFFDMEGVARESGAGSGQLLIIDDLDVVIGDVDEAGSSPVESDLESEQLRALDAIVRLVDGAANGAPSRRCFVLGICRSPLSRFPHRLARVGRFEKEVVMPPPTLAQRRDIFRFWLSTLPTTMEVSYPGECISI